MLPPDGGVVPMGLFAGVVGGGAGGGVVAGGGFAGGVVGGFAAEVMARGFGFPLPWGFPNTSKLVNNTLGVRPRTKKTKNNV